MATGRMIVNAICADKRVNKLSDDTSRLAFTWLITFADREGRTYGDPGVVRSMLFPRRQDVSIEQMETYIAEWAQLGLIVWYETEDDKWIYFPTFDKNQPGLRKEKESPSRIPPPPVADDDNTTPPEVRNDDGVSTPEVPFKRINKKGIKEKGTEEKTPPQPPARPEIFTVYEKEIGMLTPSVTDKLIAAENEYPPGWVGDALQEASSHNKRSWAYAAAILKRWKVDGRGAGSKPPPGGKPLTLQQLGYSEA